MAVGAAVGMAAGSTVDLNNARVGSDFIDDVQKALSPNKVAVIAEIETRQKNSWVSSGSGSLPSE